MEIIGGIRKILFKRKITQKKEDRSVIRYIELSAELEKDDLLLIRKTGNMGNSKGSYLEDALKNILINSIKNVYPLETLIIDCSRSSNLGPPKSHYTLRISLE